MIRILHITITSILLWILGLVLLSLLKGAFLEQELKSNATYIVELTPMILPGQRIIAESLIKDMAGVRSSSVTIINKEEAKSMMLPDFPRLGEGSLENPFRDLIIFKADQLSNVELMNLEHDIEQIKGVSSFYFEKDVYSGLKSGISRFRWSLLAMSIILLIAVVLMIAYALNQVLIQNKNKTQVLHLAGVLDNDIIRPYVMSGLKTSIICSSIAIIALVLNILFINRTLLNGVEISFLQAGIACIFVLIISALIYAATTVYATKSFINQS